MDDETEVFTPIFPAPTASRPLLGLTVLVVEDSRYACEAMRLLCLRSGARIRRADSLRSAGRHLKVYRPSIAVVDLGLPDGSGTSLISEMATDSARPEVILGISGDPGMAEKALAAGADGFLEKPITSLTTFQTAILSKLPSERRPSGPRAVTSEQIRPDPIAYRDDIAHAADLLEDITDNQSIDYLAQFLGGVARSAEDRVLAAAAEALASRRAMGRSASSEIATLAGLVQERLSRKLAI